MSRRYLLLGGALLVAVAGLVFLDARRVQATQGEVSAVCAGNLSPPASTLTLSAVQTQPVPTIENVSGGGLRLNTALSPLDPERIILPFDQQVIIKSVYSNPLAGASHSFGWFYLDKLYTGTFAPPNHLWDTTANAGAGGPTLDANGIPKIFQQIYKKATPTSVPYLADSASSYAEPTAGGGNWLRLPNILEPYHPTNNVNGFSNLIFWIMNDGPNTSYAGGGLYKGGAYVSTYALVPTTPVSTTGLPTGFYMPAAADRSTAQNGIFDYDVNFDGTVGNEADRQVDLGTIQGNREVVFYAITYYGQTITAKGVGLNSTGTQAVKIFPYFSKTSLNPEYGSGPVSSPIEYLDIAGTHTVCYAATPAATATGMPTLATSPATATCPFDVYTRRYPEGIKTNPVSPFGPDARYQNVVYGWMSGPAATAGTAINRLSTAAYGSITLAHEVIRVKSTATGTIPHMIVGAPSSYPNLWILGIEDLATYHFGYPAGVTGPAVCATCTKADYSWNDVVLLVNRSNGGQVISNEVAQIPTADKPTTTISKIRIQATASFPGGCATDPSAQIRLYWSVQNPYVWHQIPTTPGQTSVDTTVDVLATGDLDSEVYWRADFLSSKDTCQPVLNSITPGWEAVKHGEYKFAATIPLSNVAYTGSIETPIFSTVSNNDYSPRGHFYSRRLFEPTAPSTSVVTQNWDAGPLLAARDPNTRAIYTVANGALTQFTTTNGTTLYPLILPTSIRSSMSGGVPVYDYNGSGGTADDTDAQFVLQWTRGWEFPAGITFTPAQAVTQRAWKLGPIHNSTPAILGPPPKPLWADGSAAPATMVSTHASYRTTQVGRATLALVGAQDGMLHAFEAGQFRNGADSACPATLERGCYAGATDGARYGSGAEQWAFIPPSQLSQLKNNYPGRRSYYPSSNTPAEVDGSVSVEDIFVSATSTWKTIAFASLGRNQPYITAVDVTNPSAPAMAWTADWTDVDFNGTELSPSVGLTSLAGGSFAVVMTSGLSSALEDLYLYLINPLSGTTLTGGKIKLNTGAYAAQAYGIAGYPSLVDANQDGLVDRIYAVDTSGRIWKYDLGLAQACVVAALGESVYSGLAIEVGGTASAPSVRIFAGGGPSTSGVGTTGSDGRYHAFSFVDSNTPGSCSAAVQSFKVALNAGEKVWAAPASSNGSVFYATATSTVAGICATDPGRLLGYSQAGDGANPTTTQSPVSLPGTPVSSFRVYDGHLFVNTIGGQTRVLGGSAWNNATTGSGTGTGAVNLRTILWEEQ